MENVVQEQKSGEKEKDEITYLSSHSNDVPIDSEEESSGRVKIVRSDVTGDSIATEVNVSFHENSHTYFVMRPQFSILNFIFTFILSFCHYNKEWIKEENKRS